MKIVSGLPVWGRMGSGSRSKSSATRYAVCVSTGVVSLALHVVAVLTFGTIKFVSEVLREETVFEAAPVIPPPQKEPEYTVNLQQRNQSVPPPRPPAIVVNNPSELNIPALDIDVDVDSSAVYGRGCGIASIRVQRLWLRSGSAIALLLRSPPG